MKRKVSHILNKEDKTMSQIQTFCTAPFLEMVRALLYKWKVNNQQTDILRDTAAHQRVQEDLVSDRG